MRAGDIVVYGGDVDYGRMLLVEVRKDGLLACLVDPDSWHRRTEYFSVHELEFAPALEAA